MYRLLDRSEPSCRIVSGHAKRRARDVRETLKVSVGGNDIQNACVRLETAHCENALCCTSRARPLRRVVPLDRSSRCAAKAAANLYMSAEF